MKPSRVRYSIKLPRIDDWEAWCSLIPVLLAVDQEIGQQLVRYWRSGQNVRNLYKVYPKNKRRRGHRAIQAPPENLKTLQRAILDSVLEKADLHSCCHGFRKGRSIFTNALVHVGKDVVLVVDIRDFFPCIRPGRVYGVFRKLGVREPAASFMTDMCVFNDSLPTGAPTSPMLANIICLRLDTRLHGLMRTNHGDHTRLADDGAFSGARDIITLRSLIRRIMREEGFEQALHKVKIQPKGYRQKVAGIIVNEKVSVPRIYYRAVRAAVHRFSLGGTPMLDGKMKSLRSLRGKVGYVALTRPEAAGRLSSMLNARRQSIRCQP